MVNVTVAASEIDLRLMQRCFGRPPCPPEACGWVSMSSSRNLARLVVSFCAAKSTANCLSNSSRPCCNWARLSCADANCILQLPLFVLKLRGLQAEDHVALFDQRAFGDDEAEIAPGGCGQRGDLDKRVQLALLFADHLEVALNNFDDFAAGRESAPRHATFCPRNPTAPAASNTTSAPIHRACFKRRIRRKGREVHWALEGIVIHVLHQVLLHHCGAGRVNYSRSKGSQYDLYHIYYCAAKGAVTFSKAEMTQTPRNNRN